MCKWSRDWILETKRVGFRNTGKCRWFRSRGVTPLLIIGRLQQVFRISKFSVWFISMRWRLLCRGRQRSHPGEVVTDSRSPGGLTPEEGGAELAESAGRSSDPAGNRVDHK